MTWLTDTTLESPMTALLLRQELKFLAQSISSLKRTLEQQFSQF
jgi:hypothetical protein